MENLLIMMRCLKDLDALDNRAIGSQTLAEVVNAVRPVDAKDPKQQQLFELMKLAADHAEVTTERERTTDPQVRRALSQHMDRLRYEVSQKAAAYQKEHGKLAGQELIAELAPLGPGRILGDQKKGVVDADVAAFRQMRGKYAGLRYAWSDIAEMPSPEQMKAILKSRQGLGARLSEKMWDETMQLGNVVLGLQMLEMYQNDAAWTDYATVLGTDLIGRYRWYLGYVGQAAQIRSQTQAVDFGKNIIFDLLSKAVPGCGTVKIVFDIEKGLVMVTFGYAVNQANAALIDAMYTGPAGRINTGTEGKAAGRIRDAGECVLDAALVKRVTGKDGKDHIEIDRASLYRRFFRDFAGIEFDLLPRPMIADKAQSDFVKAHDALITAMRKQCEQAEPTWFNRVAEYFNPSDLDTAMTAFKKVLEDRCAKRANASLDALAVRQFYTKDADGNVHEVISEGLRMRLLTDFVSGMISTWQSELMEQVLLKREIESLADAADMSALSAMLAKESFQPRKAKGKWVLSIDHGMPHIDTELDGGKPLPLTCELRRFGPPGEDVGNVVLQATCGEPEPVDRNYRPVGMMMAGATTRASLTDTAMYWKDVVRQPVTVKAVANGGSGPVLAETTRSFYVRVAQPEARKIRLDDLKLAPGDWPSFFTSEGRFCSITRLTDVQPLENWTLEKGRSVGETSHSKLVYNQKRDPDGFVWRDEQEIDMSWAVERADGGSTHIETPDTNIVEVRTDDGSVVKKV